MFFCRYIPHLVCGDMDSARQEVLDLYESKVLTLLATVEPLILQRETSEV